jgi:hypothetical protein
MISNCDCQHHAVITTLAVHPSSVSPCVPCNPVNVFSSCGSLDAALKIMRQPEYYVASSYVKWLELVGA